MASTNKTINYKLSQYTANDKPTYLSDYNSDMNKIDTQMKANNDLAGLAKTEADDLSSRVDGQDVVIGTLNTTVGQHTTDINTLNTNVSAVNTKVGDLTNLNTTDKTDVVSAVNEVNTKVGDLTNLSTTAKSNIVSAVNEVNSKKEVFSTDEVKTNKVWIDGKPIYRKVIPINITTETTSWNTDLSSFDCNELIQAYGFIGTSTLKTAILSDDQSIVFRPNSKLLELYFNTGSSINNETGYIVIEYTKTID